MIITKTPFRMSFFGGGTDLPEFFNGERGCVISTSIDKYCYVIARHLPRFFEYTTELSYAKTERVTSIDEIVHPAIRETIKMLDMHEIRLTYDADLPARSGLGTSSSFVVGMLNAFYAMKGRFVDKRRLAEEAIHVERVLCNEAGGWQDQIAAAYGGFNRIDFYENSFEVHPIVMNSERKSLLNHRLLMFFTGFTRMSSEVQAVNIKSDPEERKKALKDMLAITDEACEILTENTRDLDDFGRLLDQTWRLKRRTGSGVTTGNLDAIYERGIRAGALGGKLLGAGGGGFMIFYVPEGKEESVKQEMSDLLYIPFEFEQGGSQIVYYTEEDYTLDGKREM